MCFFAQIRPSACLESDGDGIGDEQEAEQGHCTELPPSVAVSMRRILRTLYSLAAPVAGGSR